ncbi:MAG: fumarate hydratase [Candidatus Altiarchaeales archaeon]|nr:MAG: fumarate hydratase [Candidatus Altiarchaeales archaeon]
MIYLNTPLSERDIKKLKIGEFVYLSGIVVTARDKAHERALNEGAFPIDIENCVIFHSGPIVKRNNNEWKVIAIGPTTSARMNNVESDFIKRFKIRGIIGKGGMNKKIFRENKCIYFAMTGGCASIGAMAVENVKNVYWLELGIPEAVWVLKVRNLGPLLVAIDSNGNSVYENQI